MPTLAMPKVMTRSQKAGRRRTSARDHEVSASKRLRCAIDDDLPGADNLSAIWAGGSPSGRSPMSSGLRRTKINAGATTKSGAMMPNTAQVLRQPMRTNKDAATKGMLSLAMPVPKLAMPIARPRWRTNHWAIVTLMTREPSNASPAMTNEQRTRTNCQKLCTWLESNKPAPSIMTPRTSTPRPPWRSIHGPSSGTIIAATPISKVRISENAPTRNAQFFGDRFEEDA